MQQTTLVRRVLVAAGVAAGAVALTAGCKVQTAPVSGASPPAAGGSHARTDPGSGSGSDAKPATGVRPWPSWPGASGSSGSSGSSGNAAHRAPHAPTQPRTHRTHHATPTPPAPHTSHLAVKKPHPPTTEPLDTPDRRCRTGRVLCISKKSDTLAWMVDGKVVSAMDVRFGSQYTPTREGAFKVDFKSRHHVSTIYHSAMPYAMFFSGGQAVHYSSDFAARGYAGASHGCINVRDKKKIAALFREVRRGDRVVVYR
ncbi:L,D-transpeptidase [Streptomyces sp. NPDC050617]|uniref:L,D-transpeptidase n=1 Tax=Streptomyces sp. NPDC050617 TaxID=3154628 RepID=UPI003434C8B8